MTTMLIRDHPHLFETGGENYHTDFTAWDYERGHESDAWRTLPDPTWAGAPALPAAAAHAHALRRLADWFRSRGGLPRSQDDGAPRPLDPDGGRPARALLPVRRRVRPARALRHARALGLEVRPRLGRAAT